MSKRPVRRAILLVDHGSRLEAANRVVQTVAECLADRLGPDAFVSHAHQESAQPDIDEAFDALVRAGATEVVVVPFFLAPGRHATEDVPKLAKLAAARHPGVEVVCVSPPLPAAAAALASIVADALSDATKPSRSPG